MAKKLRFKPWLSSRTLSPRMLKRVLNCFPPLIFQRIKILEIGPEFQSCRVRIARSLLTRNLHGTTFGGTLFSAADSPLPVLLWQIFAHRGIQVESWLQSGQIRYEKPAASDLFLEFRLSDEEIEAAATELQERGRFRRSHELTATDEAGVVYARICVEAYVRLSREENGGLSAF
ncbi:MAG: YiiD C-terminal domain-containing protein [bacterium]|jgi:hypothetical protein|nr:DUF4442 domain-containing protein [Planctomycetota bacterium]HIL53149.1 DUF4442 domain-containing protein [Planctomycetota bacterium]